MNTKKSGALQFIVFREDDGDYCAVCLTLDLVEWGKDPSVLLNSIVEAAHSYVEGVIEHDLPDELLNKPASKMYWNIVQKQLQPVQRKTQQHTCSDFWFNKRTYGDGTSLCS